MEINGRTNDSVFIVRVEWKGRISFSLNLVCMEKFYASLTGIENTRRGGECDRSRRNVSSFWPSQIRNEDYTYCDGNVEP